MTMTVNIFSNQNSDLPSLENLKLPKIKKGLPKIEMTKDDDLLFEIDGQSFSLDDIADRFGRFYA